MAYKNQFEKELKSLLNRRTNWLLVSLFKPRPGRPLTLDKKAIGASVLKLQKLATKALARGLARTEFEKCVVLRKKWQIRGHGQLNKRNNFIAWFDTHFSTQRHYIYIIWGKNGKCLYVGRTSTAHRRPTQHFNKYWFPQAVRIEILSASSYKDVPKLECLSQHHFVPSYNAIKSSTKKWTSRCPLCAIHKNIEIELTSIFT